MALPIAGAALLGAGVSGAASLGSSVINYFSQKKTNEQQYEYNKKLAEQAYERNVAQWMRENAYNTPSMQVARMTAAGINPQTAFGNGAEVSSGNAGGSPQLSYGQYNPQAPFFDVNSPIQNAFQAYLLQAKRDNIEADTGLKTGQTRKVIRETNNLEVEYEKLLAQVAGLNLDNEAKEIANRFIEREKEAKIANLESGTQLNNEQQRQVAYITDKILPKEVQLKDASLKDFEEKWSKWHSEVELWASQVAKNDAEKDLLIRDAENYALNHMQSGFMGTGLSVPNVFRTADQGRRNIKKIGRTVIDEGKKAFNSTKKEFKGVWKTFFNKKH